MKMRLLTDLRKKSDAMPLVFRKSTLIMKRIVSEVQRSTTFSIFHPNLAFLEAANIDSIDLLVHT